MNFRRQPIPKTTIRVSAAYIGESIEDKVYRMKNNREPITAEGFQHLYTNRKDGVLKETDIRTDRFELANDMMEMNAKTQLANREAFHKNLMDQNQTTDKKDQGGTKDGGAESTQGTKPEGNK